MFIDFFRMDRFDIEPCLIEYIGNLSEESFFISECEFYFYRDSFDFRIVPVCWDATIEFYSFHILAVEFMYRYDSHSYGSYDFVSVFRITTLGFLIRDISLFTYDYIIFTLCIDLFGSTFLFDFFRRFYLSEKFFYRSIIESLEYTCRFA